MSQENVELVRRMFAFFKAFEGRIETDEVTGRLPDAALGDFFDPKLEWFPIPEGVLGDSTYRGFDGFRHWVADFPAVWDEFHMEPQEFLDRGDQVVAVVRARGRLHELEIDEVWSGLFSFRDGRVVRVQNFGTREGALEAAGLRE
jgi:ketosteroid isomerase-like protein